MAGGDVGVSLFVASAVFGDVGVALFVAGAIFELVMMLECHLSWLA